MEAMCHMVSLLTTVGKVVVSAVLKAMWDFMSLESPSSLACLEQLQLPGNCPWSRLSRNSQRALCI